MGINQLWGDIESGAYSHAIYEVALVLNEVYNLSFKPVRDWATVHTLAERLNIRFDKDGNII